AGDLERLADHVFAGRLQRGALHAALAVAGPHQTRRAELLRFVDEVVEILARVTAGLRDHEAAHFAAPLDRAAEHGEIRRGERRRQILQLHARAQVRLVAAEPRHRLGVRHAAERLRRVAPYERHQAPHQRLEDREDEVLGGEGNLEVHLRELRLSIGAQILVAEALRDLEVAIHARDHQDLLEDLRRLRQREELAGVHAARHQVVARPFGRRLGEDRRLDLEEALLVEVLPHRERRLVAQDHVLLDPRTPQIEIAVAQPHLLGDLRVLVDRERRGLGVVEQADLARVELDLAGLQLRVDGFLGARFDAADHADDELRAQPLGLGLERFAVHDHLRDAVAVAHVEEQHAAEIAHAVHPAKEDDVLVHVTRREYSTGVGASERAERFYCHCASDVRCEVSGCRRPRSEVRGATAEATEALGRVCCWPVLSSLILTSPRASSSWPSTATKRARRASAYLKALPRSLPPRSGSGYISTRKPPPRSSVASRSASAVSVSSKTVTSTSGPDDCRSPGNMLRSPITTRRRSSPGETPQAGICSPENIPINPS